METLTGLEQLFDAEHLVMLDDEDMGMMGDLEAELLNDGIETPLATLPAFDDSAALLEPRQVKRSLYGADNSTAPPSKNHLETISALQAKLRETTEELRLLKRGESAATDELAMPGLDQDWLKMEIDADIDAGSLSGDDSYQGDFLTESKDEEHSENSSCNANSKSIKVKVEVSKNGVSVPVTPLYTSSGKSSLSPSGGATTGNKRPLASALDLATSTTASGSPAGMPQKKRVKGLLGRKTMSEPAMSTKDLINSDITPETAGSDAANRGKKFARRWTAEQDNELRIAVEKNNGQNWKAIARMVTDRDHVQCLQRWKKVLQPGLVKGMWSKEEDQLLLDLMSSSQPKNWADIAAKVPGRTAKQCRERWSLNLDPSINRQAWSQDEDELLLKLHDKLGNRWAEIKRHLNGRTENGVKTRFKSIERARAKDKEVVWTQELESQLHEIAVRFECRIDEVAKHLPRALRGISSQAMRAHCELLRNAQAKSCDASFV